MIDTARGADIGRQIVEGYRRVPQEDGGALAPDRHAELCEAFASAVDC